MCASCTYLTENFAHYFWWSQTHWTFFVGLRYTMHALFLLFNFYYVPPVFILLSLLPVSVSGGGGGQGDRPSGPTLSRKNRYKRKKSWATQLYLKSLSTGSSQGSTPLLAVYFCNQFCGSSEQAKQMGVLWGSDQRMLLSWAMCPSLVLLKCIT